MKKRKSKKGCIILLMILLSGPLLSVTMAKIRGRQKQHKSDKVLLKQGKENQFYMHRLIR